MSSKPQNATTDPASRYVAFGSHYVPRTATGRGVVVAYLLLLAFAEWPLLPWANRIEPTFLGFPFIFAYLGVIYVAKIAVLIYAARRQL